MSTRTLFRLCTPRKVGGVSVCVLQSRASVARQVHTLEAGGSTPSSATGCSQHSAVFTVFGKNSVHPAYNHVSDFGLEYAKDVGHRATHSKGLAPIHRQTRSVIHCRCSQLLRKPWLVPFRHARWTCSNTYAMEPRNVSWQDSAPTRMSHLGQPRVDLICGQSRASLLGAVEFVRDSSFASS